MADDGADSEAPGVAFAAYLKKGEIRLQICGACGKQIFFPPHDLPPLRRRQAGMAARLRTRLGLFDDDRAAEAGTRRRL